MCPKKCDYLTVLSVLLMLAVSASAGAQSNTSISPETAVDFDSAPGVVEVFLIAEESTNSFQTGKGGHTAVYTYNGMTPGPTIEANVGDTLIVNLENRLPVNTTLHWHGLELPANMDGSHISQLPVEPGQTYRYEFPLLTAATYWYHPHISGNEQVEKGLHGALIVHDPELDTELDLPVSEHVLILDDILLGDDGQIAPPFPDDPLGNAETQVNGRMGNHLLVNGKILPTRKIERGYPHRLRLINTANSRFMRVDMPGQIFYRISGDGGLLENPVLVEPIEMIADPSHPDQLISDPDPSKGLLLTPGERVEIVFTPTGSDPIDVVWHDMPRGGHSASYRDDGSIALGHKHSDGKSDPVVMMRLKPFGKKSPEQYVPPQEMVVIDPIDAEGAEVIKLELGHSAPDVNGDINFFVQRKDGLGLPFGMVTPEDAPMVEVGETRIIEVTNLTGGDHNFHLHGFFFQLIDVQYIDMDTPENNRTVASDHMETEDTIRIPARTGAMMRSKTVTRLAVRFEETGREGEIAASGKLPGIDTSGGWVFHCHILDHSDRGMMSYLQIEDPS